MKTIAELTELVTLTELLERLPVGRTFLLKHLRENTHDENGNALFYKKGRDYLFSPVHVERILKSLEPRPCQKTPPILYDFSSVRKARSGKSGEPSGASQSTKARDLLISAMRSNSVRN